MGKQREYEVWRQRHNIQPWVETRPKADNHAKVRSEVKGRKRRAELIRDYDFLFDARDVATLFKSTVDYYTNVGLVFRHKESGEYKRLPICSRWNLKDDAWYKKRYWDIHDSVKNETKVTMLSIGYDQRRMYEVMEEEGWHGDFYGYLMNRLGKDISGFLKRLRSFYKRKGREWTYRGYAIEPYRVSGLPHIHFYFAGSWIAPLENIIHLWQWSKSQGIKVTVRTGKQVAGYLSSYLRKATECMQGNRVHLFYAYAYFLGVSLYRVAYGKRKKDDECESVQIKEGDVPIVARFEKGRWECVGTDILGSEGVWDRRFLPFGKDERVSVGEYERGLDIRGLEKDFIPERNTYSGDA